ncbi:10865_t:CDS:1, partial [Racocetra persica]
SLKTTIKPDEQNSDNNNYKELELDENEDNYQSGQDDDNYNTEFRDPEDA